MESEEVIGEEVKEIENIVEQPVDAKKKVRISGKFCDGCVRRGMKGEIPASLGEALVHDLIGTIQGIIPFVPEPAGIIRTGRIIRHKELSGGAKSFGAAINTVDVVLSAIDPTSISDLVLLESTIWYLTNRKEIREVHGRKKLWGKREYKKMKLLDD